MSEHMIKQGGCLHECDERHAEDCPREAVELLTGAP